MSSRLEQFILDHREEFDGEEPDKKIWEIAKWVFRDVRY